MMSLCYLGAGLVFGAAGWAGLAFGAAGCVYAAFLIVRQREAERELTKKVGDDSEFLRLRGKLVRDLASPEGGGQRDEKSRAEARKQAMDDIAKLFEAKAETLDPEKRNLVNAGLWQQSDIGRRDYLDKLAKLATEQSEKKNTAATGPV